MTYLQQSILIPATGLEELKFLGELVTLIGDDEKEHALNLIMSRMVSIERYSGSRLAVYDPQLEANPQ